MARSKSSKRWLDEHFSDPFVKKAHAEGHRSRAVYKLMQIQTKYHLLKPGMVVVDLGAAPGSWSVFAKQCVGRIGQVIALDILPMTPIDGVIILQGDFGEEAALAELRTALNGRTVDAVISDIAPNTSGNPAIDQPRAMLLAELALEFAREVKVSVFITKLLHGSEFDVYLKTLRQDFKRVILFKPEASRDRSREVYALCHLTKGNLENK